MDDKKREKAKQRFLAKRRRKQRLKRAFAFSIIIIFVLAICVGLSLTVFFSIDTVQISTNTGYSDSEILDMADVDIGDNLIIASTERIKTNLLSSLTTCDGVTVTKKLPNTLVIEVNTAVPAFAVMRGGKSIIYSCNFRVVDKSWSTDLPIVVGVDLEIEPQVGEYLSEGELLRGIISEIVEYDMSYITDVDISDIRNVTLEIKDKLVVELKGCNDLEYQMEFVRYFIENEMLPTDVGTLDASEPGTVRFIPNN